MTTNTHTRKQDRLSDAVAQHYRSDTLVGSFFLADDEKQWQGCVVAEVAPQVYLVELFDWLVGASSEQRLVRLTSMLDWHFFDDAEWMRNSSENIQRRWNRDLDEENS